MSCRSSGLSLWWRQRNTLRNTVTSSDSSLSWTALQSSWRRYCSISLARRSTCHSDGPPRSSRHSKWWRGRRSSTDRERTETLSSRDSWITARSRRRTQPNRERSSQTTAASPSRDFALGFSSTLTLPSQLSRQISRSPASTTEQRKTTTTTRLPSLRSSPALSRTSPNASSTRQRRCSRNFPQSATTSASAPRPSTTSSTSSCGSTTSSSTC
mmetsp:Transcript_12959/g.51708  ORF Transcript_12959/g.51708 Transcript_12959/m.51708 type:complete len:213 (+) Transcript_12959:359-997(+)